MNIIIFHGWGGWGKQYLAPPLPICLVTFLTTFCINKDNILDLIYIKFINTHFIGGQNILSPPPVFLNGGSDTKKLPPPFRRPYL